MCGLAGVAGVVDFKSEKMFQNLLFLNQLRGTDSTGIAVVKGNGDNVTFKKAVAAMDFMEMKGFDSALKGVNRIVMGHCRAATKGSITSANAHPFEFENVIGMHNGTLNSQYQLKDHLDFKVDSENIYHHMNLEGVDDTWEKLNGAAALTWIDKKSGELNFLRNDKREFHFVLTKDNKQLFWSSEKWMLIVAANRAGIELQDIMELPVDTLYKIGFNHLHEPVIETRMVAPYAPKWQPTTATAGTQAVVGGGKSKKPKNAGNLKEGDDVVFEVTHIRDIFHSTIQYANVSGVTAAGVSVKIYNINAQAREELLTRLQLSTNYFTASIIGMNEHEIVLGQNTIQEITDGTGGKDDYTYVYCDYCFQLVETIECQVVTSHGKAYYQCEKCCSHKH